MVHGVFKQHQQADGGNKHRRAAVEIPGIGKGAVNRELPFSAEGNQRHAGDKTPPRQPADAALLRVHGADRPAKQRVQQVINRIAIDIQIDRQPVEAGDRAVNGVRVRQQRQHQRGDSQIAGADRFNLNQRGKQVDSDDREEEPQVVEHRLLQQMFHRHRLIDRRQQRDINQRHRAVKQQAQHNAQKVAPLGAALAEEQVAGDHKEDRHAHARRGVKQVGEVPAVFSYRHAGGDVPGGGVDHNHHQAGNRA